jgi:hypothetical protein
MCLRRSAASPGARTGLSCHVERNPAPLSKMFPRAKSGAPHPPVMSSGNGRRAGRLTQHVTSSAFPPHVTSSERSESRGPLKSTKAACCRAGPCVLWARGRRRKRASVSAPDSTTLVQLRGSLHVLARARLVEMTRVEGDDERARWRVLCSSLCDDLPTPYPSLLTTLR